MRFSRARSARALGGGGPGISRLEARHWLYTSYLQANIQTVQGLGTCIRLYMAKSENLPLSPGPPK